MVRQEKHSSYDFLTERFYAYTNWMQKNNILKLAEESNQNEIRKNDFTDFGFGFCQKYHDKFIDRMYKSKNVEEDLKFLNKWLSKYKESAEQKH